MFNPSFEWKFKGGSNGIPFTLTTGQFKKNEFFSLQSITPAPSTAAKRRVSLVYILKAECHCVRSIMVEKTREKQFDGSRIIERPRECCFRACDVKLKKRFIKSRRHCIAIWPKVLPHFPGERVGNCDVLRFFRTHGPIMTKLTNFHAGVMSRLGPTANLPYLWRHQYFDLQYLGIYTCYENV